MLVPQNRKKTKAIFVRENKLIQMIGRIKYGSELKFTSLTFGENCEVRLSLISIESGISIFCLRKRGIPMLSCHKLVPVQHNLFSLK
jgi:hypothetical protein